MKQSFKIVFSDEDKKDFEKLILEMARMGKNYVEIAEKVGIGNATVKEYVKKYIIERKNK